MGGITILSLNRKQIKKSTSLLFIILFILSTILITTPISSHSLSRNTPRGVYIIDLNSTTDHQHGSAVIYGAQGGDYATNSMACADINNDSIDDIIIGAYYADGPGNSRNYAGEVYVIFGDSVNETIDLATDANITIYGATTYDRLGQAITTGDINGDSIQDLIIGAPSADGAGEARLGCGEVYVFYGNDTFQSTYDLLTTSPDLLIYGPDANDSCGYSLATGDIDGDTIDDILIGAYWGDGPTNAGNAVGEVYMIKGATNLPPMIDLFLQVPVTIYGVDDGDYCGATVASGDVNNDNFDDIIIGAYWADGPGNARQSCGEVYLVYGNTTLPLSIDLSVNSNMTVYGTKRGTWGSYLGASLSSGDINNDNFDDIVMSAYYEYVNAVLVGSVHVIYGTSSLPSTWDIHAQGSDTVIQGADNQDRAGNKVLAADYNGDSFSDIILTANWADGQDESRLGCGEVYVINGSSTMPPYINISNDDEDVIIFGNEAGDYIGYSLAAGDIDNDNCADILVGTYMGDGPDNARMGCGEAYLILSSDEYVPKLKTEFIGLTNGDGPDSNLCYAEYKPYSFKVRVTDPNGYSDVKSATLALDHEGVNIKCKWTQQTDTFEELSDPNDYIDLSSTSSSARFGLNSWVIYFNITFNWEYPDNGLHNLQVYGDADSGLYNWLNVTNDIYRVENQVKLIGALDVLAEYQGEIYYNDWIRGGEPLYWKSIRIAYNGTTDYYPPSSAGASVTVWAPDGKSWSDNPLPGENISIQSTTENVTQESVIYTINITGIPDHCDISDETFIVNIDGDIVMFTSPTPLETEWQNTLTPACGVVISDPTTVVSTSSIQYRVSTDDGATWVQDWTSADITASDWHTIECQVTPTLSNGATNIIQWRAKDNVGNNYNASEFYRVKVDTEPVIFHNAYPLSKDWQANLSFDCGITIFDNLSGINASSIEYRTSTEGINNYSSWQSAGISIDGDHINAAVTPTFEEGTDNYIQWRAKDIIGNGPTESIDYQYKILLNYPPVSKLLSPTSGMIFQTQQPELLWEGSDRDGDKPIYYTVYMSTDEAKVFSQDPSALLVISTEETKFKFNIALADSTTYYWTVIPNDGQIDGSCQSGIWNFRIETTVEIPKVTLVAPYHNYSISSTNPDLVWSVNYSNVEILKYNVFIDTKPDPESFIPDFDTLTYKPTTPLVRGKTYYWTVIPVAETTDGTVQGECESGIWKFKVDLEPDRIYGIELDLESSKINVEQGKSVVTNITVRNSGTHSDTFMIRLSYSGFQAGLELVDVELPFKLNANQSKTIKLEISTYISTTVRGYLVDITVISQGAKSELIDESVTEKLEVRVTEPEVDEGEDGTDKEEGDYFLWILLLVVAVIIILVVFFVLKRKKKEPDVTPEVDAEVLYQPSLGSDELPDDKKKAKVKAKKKEKEEEPEMEVLEPDIEEAPEILTQKTYEPKLKPKGKKPRVQKTDEILEPVIDQPPEPGASTVEPTDIQSEFDQMPTLEPEIVEGELVDEPPVDTGTELEPEPTPSVDVHLPDQPTESEGPEVLLPEDGGSDKPLRKPKKGLKGLD